MSLFISGMSSCAVQEIALLGQHPNAQSAMRQFCIQTLGIENQDVPKNGGYNAYAYDNGEKKNGNLGSYSEGLGENYVFHGPEYNEKFKAFADFIKEEKLGNVVAGEAVINHRYHPDHKCRVYLWNPDRRAVIAWWEANRPKPAPPVVIASAEPEVAAAIEAGAKKKALKVNVKAVNGGAK